MILLHKKINQPNHSKVMKIRVCGRTVYHNDLVECSQRMYQFNGHIPEFNESKLCNFNGHQMTIRS